MLHLKVSTHIHTHGTQTKKAMLATVCRCTHTSRCFLLHNKRAIIHYSKHKASKRKSKEGTYAKAKVSSSFSSTMDTPWTIYTLNGGSRKYFLLRWLTNFLKGSSCTIRLLRLQSKDFSTKHGLAHTLGSYVCINIQSRHCFSILLNSIRPQLM